MTEPVTETPTTKKPMATRSPSYPYIDLKEALAKAEAFRLKEGRNSAQREVGVVHWGYGSKSSGGKQTLGALRSFGLMEPEGPMKLTENALRVILDKRDPSPERDALLRKMALLPAIHKRLWERYGNDLPSNESLRHSLIFDEGFNENTVDDFIKEYKATIGYVGLSDSGMMPPEGEEQGENPPGGTVMEMPSAPPAAKSHNPPPVAPTAVVTPPPSGFKQDVFTLSEGDVVLRWPEGLSKESFDDFKDWLEVMQKKIARAAGVAPQSERK
jgi:hypothetical protein